MTSEKARVLTVSLLLLFAFAGGAFAQTTELDFPFFGIADGQICRFSVTCADDSRPGECRGRLGFRSPDHQPIGPTLDVDLARRDAHLNRTRADWGCVPGNGRISDDCRAATRWRCSSSATPIRRCGYADMGTKWDPIKLDYWFGDDGVPP